MNLKNSIEMLNSELSNTSSSSFNQTSVHQSINPHQWISTTSSSQISPSQHPKNFINNLPVIYNEIPPAPTSTTEATFSCLTNQAYSQANSNASYFSNSNLINLSQDSTPSTNIQLNDQPKVFANSQLSPHYYNHLHAQPLINNNSLVNNSNIYDFTSELCSNGQKSYLDPSVQHVVNTTNNFHHYNISLHHPNNNSSTNNSNQVANHSTSAEPSINFHQLQLENNSLDQQNQTNLTTSISQLSSTKKRKKAEQSGIVNNIQKNCSEINKTILKNSIKKEPNSNQNNQLKDENKQQTNLDLNLDLSDNYANYDYFNANEHSEPNYSSNAFLDTVFQSIKFYPFQQNTWHNLYDENFNKLGRPRFDVYADKGFNFSNIDDVFICQKKNHFQITVHIHPIKFNDTTNVNSKLNKFNQSTNQSNTERTVYIKVKSEDGTYEFKKVSSFVLNFYGVKVESPNQTIKVEQSQSDRSKKPFLPIKVNFLNGQISKNTVGRLHFAETTSGNMRKKGRPNPDQKYFYLVASLCALIDNNKSYTVISHASERIIVRASNPGQFEMDAESCWQRSQFVTDGIYYNGKVAVGGIDDPDESLVVYGNLKLTGTLIQPSDCRIKENIKPIDTNSSLLKISNINLYSFDYNRKYNENYLKSDHHLKQREVGVIAQELIRVLPDAVKNCGQFKLNENEQLDNFLVVNKERIFFEGIAAIQELNLITLNLKNRLDKFENQIESNCFSNDNNKFHQQSSLKSFFYHLIIFVLIMLFTIGFLELIKFIT